MSDFKAFLISTTPLQRLVAAALFTALFAAAMFQFVYMAKKKQLDQAQKTGQVFHQKLSIQDNDRIELEQITSRTYAVFPTDREALDLAGNTLFTRSSLKEFVDSLPELTAGAGLTDTTVVENIDEMQDALVDKGTGETMLVRRLPVNISFSGTYENLSDFATQLWLDNHLVEIVSVDMLSQDPMTNGLSISMVLNCYYEEGI